MKTNSISKRSVEIGVSQLTLFFTDKSTETKYQDEYFNNSIYSYRLAIIISILLYGFFGILDLNVSGEHLHKFLFIRFLIVIPAMIVLWISSFFRFFRKTWQLLTSISYILAGLGMVFMSFLCTASIYYYGGLFLIFMAGYFFVNLHYLYAIGSGIVIILIYDLFPLFTDLAVYPGTEEFIVSNALFFSANIIAVVALYNYQLVARAEFYQRTLLFEQQLRIKNSNDNLEKEVEKRTELLETRNKELIKEIENRKEIEDKLRVTVHKAEESDRLKTAFLANMSHEIRTPMNGIIGFLDMVIDPEITKEEREQYLEIVKQSGDRLLQTINDIIEISKIEAGEMQENLTTVNISETFSFLNEFFQPEAKKKENVLVFHENVGNLAIRTDGYKLESILINLIKNALKFTDKGTIEIGVERLDDKFEFYVKDNGPGIPVDRQEAIFDRFVQADLSLSRGHEGAGLGLSIAKAYAEILGGKIWLKSEPEKGSTFYFTINLELADKQEIQEIITDCKQESDETINGKKTVLVAEDDEVSFKLLRTILNNENIKVVRAKDGIEAVEMYKKYRSELLLIFMDIKMPFLDGLDATRQIRVLDKNIPIIAQTAFALSGDNEKAIEAGCNDYLTKPIKYHELQSIIEKYSSID